jgi:hypothetical protein
MRTRARFHQSTAIPSKTSDLVPSLPPSPLNTDVSNRNWKLLEIVVIPTKHSPDLISNRNKTHFFAPPGVASFGCATTTHPP